MDQGWAGGAFTSQPKGTCFFWFGPAVTDFANPSLRTRILDQPDDDGDDDDDNDDDDN
jgi:hypothetical protein